MVLQEATYSWSVFKRKIVPTGSRQAGDDNRIRRIDPQAKMKTNRQRIMERTRDQKILYLLLTERHKIQPDGIKEAGR